MDWWQGWKLDDWRIQGRGFIGNKCYYSNRLKGSTWPSCKQSLFSYFLSGEETQNISTIRKGSDCRVLHDLHFNKTYVLFCEDDTNEMCVHILYAHLLLQLHFFNVLFSFNFVADWTVRIREVFVLERSLWWHHFQVSKDSLESLVTKIRPKNECLVHFGI